MSKPKKNLGKLKRYKRIFHTRDQLIRSALAWLAGIAALFVVGYAVAPAVLDFGTHTWYTVVKGRDLSAESSSAPAEPTSEAASEAASDAASQAQQEEPAAEPAPEPAVTQGNWTFATLAGFSSPEKSAETARQYKENGVHYVVIPLKDSNGYLYYQSALPDASKSVAATTIDAAAAASALRAEGLEPVAAVSAFQDPLAPYTNRDMGIHYQDTEYFWLDAAQEAGGKPWLDPWNDSTVNYIAGILSEVKAMGFDTVLLSGMQYPPYATSSCGYANGGTASAARLAELIQNWGDALAADGGTLWLQYPLASVASADPVTALGGVYSDLGVKRLMIAMPTEIDENQNELLAAAKAAAEAAGTESVVVKTGDSAVFQ